MLLYCFGCMKTSWQKLVFMQVRHMETHHWPHWHPGGAKLVSGTFRVLFWLPDAIGSQVRDGTELLAPAPYLSERTSGTGCCQLPFICGSRASFIWSPDSPQNAAVEGNTAQFVARGAGFLLFDPRKLLAVPLKECQVCKAWAASLQPPGTLC